MLAALTLLAAGAGLIQVVKLWAIVIIAICGIVAILYIILKVIGVSPPAWLINILWVILAVVIGIAAINLLVSLI
jgi:hypothetical protein